MCPVIRLETLHFEPMNVFMANEADRRPLTRNPDHAAKVRERKIERIGFTFGIGHPTTSVRKR